MDDAAARQNPMKASPVAAAAPRAVPASGGRFRRLLSHPPGYAILAVCAIVLGLRRAGAVTNPQFWAEDAYFFQRAYVFGWSSFAEPFSGYLHTILRAVAIVTVKLDPAHGPALFVALSGAVTLYVAGRTLSPRCPLPRLGGACALAVVLVPDTYEIFMNVVNLQWVVAAGLVLLLVSKDPATAAEWVHDLAAAALMGLTGPFSIVLWPLFAWRAWTRRGRASAVLAAIIAACALIQGFCVIHDPYMGGTAPVQLRLLFPLIGRRIGGSLMMGALVATNTDLYLGTVVGVATVVGVSYLAFRRGVNRPERTLLGLAFFAMLLAALYRTRYNFDWYFQPLAQARYVFIPQLIAIWLLLSAAGGKGRLARICGALAVWGLLVNIPRDREPAYVDLNWSRYEPRIRAGLPVTIPTNPPGWYMPLPARPK
jgi:hypothetical protein